MGMRGEEEVREAFFILLKSWTSAAGGLPELKTHNLLENVNSSSAASCVMLFPLQHCSIVGLTLTYLLQRPILD